MTLFGLKVSRPGQAKRLLSGSKLHTFKLSSHILISAEPDKCILLNLHRIYYRLHLLCAEGKQMNQRKGR